MKKWTLKGTYQVSEYDLYGKPRPVYIEPEVTHFINHEESVLDRDAIRKGTHTKWQMDRLSGRRFVEKRYTFPNSNSTLKARVESPLGGLNNDTYIKELMDREAENVLLTEISEYLSRKNTP